MDMSMILGLAIAGSIVLLNGNKSQTTKKPDATSKGTEFVVRLKD